MDIWRFVQCGGTGVFYDPVDLRRVEIFFFFIWFIYLFLFKLCAMRVATRRGAGHEGCRSHTGQTETEELKGENPSEVISVHIGPLQTAKMNKST